MRLSKEEPKPARPENLGEQLNNWPAESGHRDPLPSPIHAVRRASWPEAVDYQGFQGGSCFLIALRQAIRLNQLADKQRCRDPGDDVVEFT